MNKRLVVLLFLFSYLGQAQEIIFKNTVIEISALDQKRELLLQFFGDSLSVIDLKEFKLSERKRIVRPEGVSFISLKPIWKNSQLLFTEKTGGAVYKILNDSLVRLDKSNIVNWQKLSSLFVKNDTLYKYGGYGYWTATNLLSYLDPISKGWELIPYNEESPIPIGSYSQKHFIDKDQLYVFGGVQPKEANRIKNILSKDVWVLDFKSKKWRFLGTTNFPEGDLFMMIQNSNPNELELFNPQFGLLKVSIKNNKITEYKNPVYFNVTIEKGLEVFKHQDAYYYYTSKDLDVVLNKISEKNFILQSTEKTVFYKNKADEIIYFSVAAAFVLLTMILWWCFKKKKKRRHTIFVYAHKINYNKKESFITPIEFDLIKAFVKEGSIESAQILSMVYNDRLTKSHNEKIKSNTLDTLNLKLSYVLGIQETHIASEKSLEDKRIRVYGLNLPDVLLKIID
jgi:hypothetical protein